MLAAIIKYLEEHSGIATALAATIVFAVLSSAALILTAYIQGGTLFGFSFGPDARLPLNAIIMTEENCDTQAGWTYYDAAEGRIPVGAGTGIDINDVHRTFGVGPDTLGEYTHTLTIAEMPSHSHQLFGRRSSHRCSGSCAGIDASTNYQRDTEMSGGNQAHNNMPPTFGMNFCIRR